MQFIPYRANQDLSLETLKIEMDALFRHISFIGEISIMGGEPFLHKQLSELIYYIGANYRDRIGSLVITTNGTIVPELQVLKLCRDYEIFISVSDYSVALPLIERDISLLVATAESAGVNIERKSWAWMNPGRFDAEPFWDGCTQSHMQLFDGKLWQCTLMAAGYSAEFCAANYQSDCFELDNNDSEIHDFICFSREQRTTQCRRCLYPRGITIPDGIQKEEEINND
jgi:hypothetical protein